MSPIKDNPGRVTGAASIVQDLRHRKEIARALQERVSELEALMNAVPVAIFIAHDPQCQHITGNAWAHRLVQSSESTDNLSRIVPPEERPARFTIWREGRELTREELPMEYAASNGVDVRDWEIDLHREDGTVTSCLVNASPLLDFKGQVRGAIGSMLNITEQRQRQGEIELLNTRLRRSIRETHHRVKNNLQVISAMLDMQAMQHEAVVPVYELTRIGQHIKSLAIIHDMLTHQAKSDMEVYAVSVRGVLARLMPLLQAMVTGRQIRLVAAEVSLPLRQATTLTILMNELISNAIKHGKGNILVRFVAEESSLLLQVTDEGPGFPENFDPKRAANTGLDLIESLSRHDLGGHAEYANRPEGGARVSIHFPRVSATRTEGEA